MRWLSPELESCETYASSLFNVICRTGAVEDTQACFAAVPNAPAATTGCQAEGSSGLPFGMPEPGGPWPPTGPPAGSKSATDGPVQMQIEHDSKRPLLYRGQCQVPA